MKVLLATLNAKYIHSSLALRYLATYCRPICPTIEIGEYSINNKLLDILADIYAHRPRLLGLACYIWNIDMTLALAKLVKQVMPDTIIVLGGPEVSYDAKDLLENHNTIDYIIQGEGEEALAQLIGSLTGSGEVNAIDGLAWRQREGQCFVNKGPQIVKQLDELPFPYSQHDLASLQDKIIYYESSRGCPFSCQYCLSSATSGVRFFSLERVFRDLQVFIEAGVRQVKFVDRTFNANKKHYLPILRFLADQQCHTNFHLEVAADVLDDEAFTAIAHAPPGRFQMEIGVQSTYEATLSEIQRNNNWPRLMENVGRLRALGNTHLHLDLIVGLPVENYERFGQSFDDVYRLEPHMLQIGFLKMLKGSGVRRSATKHGYVFADYAPYEVLQNNYLSYGEVRRLQILEEVFNQTYNTGRYEQTLAWLVEREGGKPFRLFEALTDYWESQGLHRMAHSAKSVACYILDFYRYRYGDKDLLLCTELLKFDALHSEGGKLRPESLPWNEDAWQQEKNAFWRDEQLVRQYLPAYAFTTWRDLKRLYHIEVFSAQALRQLKQGLEVHGREVALLFDYSGWKPVWIVIEEDDFWLEGKGDAL